MNTGTVPHVMATLTIFVETFHSKQINIRALAERSGDHQVTWTHRMGKINVSTIFCYFTVKTLT